MSIDNKNVAEQGQKDRMFTEFITQAINDKVKKVAEEEFELAKKRLDERKSEIIAGVVLYVQREMSVEQMGQNLIITIRQEKKL